MDTPPPPRGRGKSLAEQMKRRAAMASEASQEESKNPLVPTTASEAIQESKNPAMASVPFSVGRGRAAMLARMRAIPEESLLDSTSSVEAESSQPPAALSVGRGRGMLSRLKGRIGNVASDAFGREEDTMSFRSDDFETSSRVGGHPQHPSPASLDTEELSEKLKHLEPRKSEALKPLKSILKASPEAEESPPSGQSKPTLYRGCSGKPIQVTSNYLRLTVQEGCGIFEYQVLFDPIVDSRDERFRLVNQHKNVLGQARSFDGHKLYLGRELDITTMTSIHSANGEDVKVSLKFKRKLVPGEREAIYLYNVAFRKIMKTLKYAQHATRSNQFFDPKSAHEINMYKLAVWPGYVTAVDEYEGGLMLQLDVAHRVLRTETVLDVLVGLAKKGTKNMKEEAEKALLGMSVITRYNNKSYRIDDITFDESPQDTFTNAKGHTISYEEYYRTQYSVAIKDKKQPMLINRPRKRGPAEADTERIIKLVPELCLLTGLTDSMRADFKIMKEVGGYTRQSPAQRQVALRTFVNRVTENEEAYSHLTDWGLRLTEETVQVQGRQLPPETIFFGNNYREVVNAKADWGRAATTKCVLTPVHLTKWAIVYVDKNEAAVRNFCKILQQQGPRMGIRVAQPRVVKLGNDRTETYLKEMRNIIDPTVQLVISIFPQMRSDRYSAIKKLCCVEMPVASQVINLKTISNEKRLTSVVQKVALQINCKLGGELWACQTPYKDIMIVGIDVYHDKSLKAGSVAGVVTSINESTSRFYSSVVFQQQGQEIMDALKIAFVEGLIKYWEANHKWPKQIVVFRDGVGDGQLETTEHHEAEQFLRVFQHVEADEAVASKQATSRLKDLLPTSYTPGFTFVVVQKRINTRVLGVVRNQCENPPPGTVLDHTVTRFKYKDFFLVPQAVNQGTVSPTHFVVIKEKASDNGYKMEADDVQKLAYKLTHMYYNWPGTVRVPAPVQYAHKLVDLVGQHIHKMPAPQLYDKLYYL